MVVVDLGLFRGEDHQRSSRVAIDNRVQRLLDELDFQLDRLERLAGEEADHDVGRGS
jgi:hypothetical protein